VFAQSRAQPQCRFSAHYLFIVHLAVRYDLTQRCLAWRCFRFSILGFNLSVNWSETSFMKQMYYAVFACHRLCLIHCRHQLMCFLNLSLRFSAYHPKNFTLQIFSTSFLAVDMCKNYNKVMKTEPIRSMSRNLAATLWCFIFWICTLQSRP